MSAKFPRGGSKLILSHPSISKLGFVFKLDNLKNKGHAFLAMQYMSPLPYYREPPPSPHGVDDQILYMTHIHAIGNNHVKYK